jgi:hypothetical protein
LLGFAAFHVLYWFLQFSFFEMTVLGFFFGFLGLLAVLQGVFDLNFKLCAFVVNGLIKGRLRNQVVSFLV